ncbi:MAG: hypothetical protein ACTSPY_04280 [Candidatus Helarchaeota archaeon]
MFTKLQEQIIQLRKKYLQTKVASILNTSQANISRIEKTIKIKIKNSIKLINYCNKEEILLNNKFKETAFENAIFILPFFKRSWEITGVSAQFILLQYYYISDEIEIRTLEPEFESLWGCKIIQEPPGPLYQIINGLRLAINEKIVIDCLNRGDTPGIKSAIVMILNKKLNYEILNDLISDELRFVINSLIYTINKFLNSYGLEKKIKFLSINMKQKIIYRDIVEKVIDDYIPFLEEK